MCGRYATPDEAALERYWTIDRRSGNPLPERFNVAPSTLVPVLFRAEDGALELSAARWGLIPAWWTQAKLPSATINARSEEVAVKPMWRQSYRRSRCLMPARGWYEWRVRPGGESSGGRPGKQPYFIHATGSPVIAFAGLLAHWQAPDGAAVLSCALLTRAAAPAETFHAVVVTPAERRSGMMTPSAPKAPELRSTAPRLCGSVTWSRATSSGIPTCWRDPAMRSSGSAYS